MAANITFTLAPAWARPGWPPGDTPETRAALNRVGATIVRTARRLAPKDTRSLESTIRHDVRRTGFGGVELVVMAGGIMGSTKMVDYAAHQEQGTSRMAAQPYLRPAVDQAVGLGRLK